MYYTSRHLRFGQLDKETFVISSGSKQELTSDVNFFNGLIDLCEFCLDGKSMEQILSYMSVNNISDKCLSYLSENLYLTDNPIDFETRYSRNFLYYQNLGYDYISLNSKISNSHIVCIGTGGIGNIVSYLSSSIGIKKITLIDDDIIELSNLNRQFLFRESDVGERKVDIVERELKKINKHIEICKIPEKINQSILSGILDATLLICSADDEYCLSLINKHCCNEGIPLLGVGYINDISVIGPFYIPNVSSCLFCKSEIYLKDNKNKKVDKINSNYKAPSMLVNNFFAGAMMTSEIIKFFAGDYENMLSLNHLVGVHNKDFRLERIEIEKNKHCTHCSGE